MESTKNGFHKTVPCTGVSPLFFTSLDCPYKIQTIQNTEAKNTYNKNLQKKNTEKKTKEKEKCKNIKYVNKIQNMKYKTHTN